SPMDEVLRKQRNAPLTREVALLRRDGSSLAIEDCAAPIRDRQGQLIGGVTVFRDVTVARSMAQRISWAATHDALTGLVNRREFEARVDAALATARNSARQHALLFMDLDRFKVVNDTSGPAAGDVFLAQVSVLFQKKLRESDTPARLGGDEFGVSLDGCPLDRAERIAADPLAAVRDFRFEWDGRTFTVGISIGLTAIGDGSASRADIFRAADAACYAARVQGRNRVCVFHDPGVDGPGAGATPHC
ncbi:MAG: diguanylate cyclase, partial [Betaproteobacteria bacterium]|nr:diguanylate cyclase [Betaproteobacteria bacterium]